MTDRAALVQATARSRYGRIAPLYDLLGSAWSFGAIAAAARAHLHRVHEGDRVLVAGAGTGASALAAARRGAHVTVVDLDATMLAAARRRFERAGIEAQLIHGNVLEHQVEHQAGHRAEQGYDVVCAPFFLDVFEPARAVHVAHHLRELLRPDGCLLVADFAGPQGGALRRATQHAYHAVPLAAFRIIARTDARPLVDMGQVVEAAGFDVVERVPVRIGGVGPAFFEAIAAVPAQAPP